MIKRTVAQVRQMLGQQAENTNETTIAIQGVCIDSRNVQKGNLFIPLKGERVNGHAYAQMAIQNGASAILWNRDEANPPSEIPVIFVEDTAKALWELAGAYRNECNYQVIGITGSNGKTSTKDLLAGVLSAKFKVMKTQGNHNNEIGVPLTLLSFDEDIDFAVVEMGMENLHEIAELCSIVKPDIGIITNVGIAHLENLGSMENIAKAKCELIEGIRDGGAFFYNGDDPYLGQEVYVHDLSRLHVSTFGEGERCDCRLSAFTQIATGIQFQFSLSSTMFDCPILGRHQAMNAAVAYLTARHLGMNDQEIQKGYHLVQATSMRNELMHFGQWCVLNDAYKSNPQSAMAALETFEQIPGNNRIAVLADMLDQGDQGPQLHRELGEACGHFKLDKVFCLGELGTFIGEGSRKAGIADVRCFLDRGELIDALINETSHEATVLFKGSRGMKLDEILAQVKEKVEQDGKN